MMLETGAMASEPARPNVTGWHSWKYNKFSSYDQLRVNLDKEFAQGQKYLFSLNGLYYQESDNKNWNVYLGETYYKFKLKKSDWKLGLLTETLGSGDKFSFVDKINSRRYYNGLANEYNRDKKEIPAVKITYFFNKKYNLETHLLPVFQASELPGIFSQWASTFQKSLALQIFYGAKLYTEKDKSDNFQYHIAFNSTFKNYELRYHYFLLKERIAVVEKVIDGVYRQIYPKEEIFAIDGNVTLSEEFLMRFELVYSPRKSYSSFSHRVIGNRFISDQYSVLMGTDHTFKNDLYMNVQFFATGINDMKSETPFQLYDFEYGSSLSLRKGFKSETVLVEFNGIENFKTQEFILTPNVTYQMSDYLKFVAGVHFNGKSTFELGPIGQFNKNNTAFFETQIIF